MSSDKASDVLFLPNIITLKANRQAVLKCISEGSRPQANLEWKRNGKPIQTGVIPVTNTNPKLSPGLEYYPSVSNLQVTPSVEDHKSVISCAAFSPKLPKEKLENEVSLNILCE